MGVIDFGGSLFVLFGVLLGHWLTRRAARELEARSRRDLLLKTLQWAAELAVDHDEAKSALGVQMLLALLDSPLSNPATTALIVAALDAVVGPVADQIERNPDAQIIYDTDDDFDD